MQLEIYLLRTFALLVNQNSFILKFDKKMPLDLADSLQSNKKRLDWQNTRLTPLEDSDLDLLYIWQNEPGLRDLTMGFRFPVQRETVKEWITYQREQNAKSHVVFAIRQQNVFVGTTRLHNIDQYQRTASLGIYIGENKRRNRGIGFVSCSLIIDYAFNGLDLRKIGLEVVSFNENAIRLFEKLGFKKEGVKTGEYYLDGKYLDIWIYGLHRADWQSNIPPTAHRLVGSSEFDGAWARSLI
jgi:UDP-4-amino-4,6-dideoxy-N-acetyl-beta-L-altrosamine N-acetyltransferase